MHDTVYCKNGNKFITVFGISEKSGSLISQRSTQKQASVFGLKMLRSQPLVATVTPCVGQGVGLSVNGGREQVSLNIICIHTHQRGKLVKSSLALSLMLELTHFLAASILAPETPCPHLLQ